MTFGTYSKAIVAAAGAIAVALGDAVFDVNDGITVVLAVLTALGVYSVSNEEVG